jgi:hypothetical protein
VSISQHALLPVEFRKECQYGVSSFDCALQAVRLQAEQGGKVGVLSRVESLGGQAAGESGPPLAVRPVCRPERNDR